MNPRNMIPLALVVIAFAGCQRGPTNTVKGPEGKELTVAVTDKLSPLSQGADQKFTVTVSRKKLAGPVKIKFDVPEGIAIKEPEAEHQFTNGTKQKFYTLMVDKNAKPQKDARVRVTASHEGMKSATADLKLTIEESLQSKAARQKEYGEKMIKRLEHTKENLKRAEKLIVSTVKKPAEKSSYLNRVGQLYKDVDNARKKLDDVTSAPAESWERNRQPVENAVSQLETATTAILNELKNQK